MKKNILMVVVGILLAGVVIGGYYGYQWYENNFSPIASKLPNMTVSEFEQKMTDKESFYVYVGRPNCGDSDIFEAWFIPDYVDTNEQIANNLYYLNIKDLQADDSAWESFKTTYGITHTPTLAFIENGEVVDMVEWTAQNDFPESMVNEWLMRNGFVEGIIPATTNNNATTMNN